MWVNIVFKVGVRVGFRLGGLAGLVKFRGRVRHCAYESNLLLHDESTSLSAGRSSEQCSLLKHFQMNVAHVADPITVTKGPFSSGQRGSLGVCAI